MTTTRTGPRIAIPPGTPAMATMFDLHEAVDAGPVDIGLLELVRARVSQVNGCAYCLDLHADRARAQGETQRRLDVLAAWRETELFAPRERAALAFAEAVTLLAGRGVPDEVLDEVELHFDAVEVRVLLFAVMEINAWNRLAVTARTPLPDPRS